MFETPSSLIRSRAAIIRALDRDRVLEIPDGAVFQEGGVIKEVGPYATLRRSHSEAPVIGTGREILLPGFVNAHHHVGLTPFQLGSPDMPLEPWLISRMMARVVDPYLDTLYAAFEMIASGITTVQHIQIGTPGSLREIEETAGKIIKAYEDVGMRASYSFAVADQNRLVYQSDDAFVASLPTETSSRLDVPMHMHLVETALQRDYAIRRGGGTAIECLDRLGILGPRLTIGHGVSLSDADLDRIAETGTCICHNCSSNFRLRAGLAPLNRIEARGINCAIGIDEAGINNDRDMLQEMRMVLRAHRLPESGGDVPTTAQVFRMATAGGAKTTPFGDDIGAIEVGKAADMILIDWDQISRPFLDEETANLDAVVMRAKSAGVATVICDGEVIYHDGRITRVDQSAALRALHASATRGRSEDEKERRWLSKRLAPHVVEFFENYADASDRLACDDGSHQSEQR